MKKNALIAVSVISITIIVSVLAIIINKANKDEQKYLDEISRYQTYYTEYQVESGDNLWSIYDKVCELYPDTSVITREDWIEEVHDINSLNGSKIISHYHLVIPYLNGLREVSE